MTRLSQHKKTASHRKNEENKIMNSFYNPNNLVDCGETIKVEDIKKELNQEESLMDENTLYEEMKVEDINEEMNEEESVEDPISIQQENGNTLYEGMKVEDIKEEMNEEESVEHPISIQREKENILY